MEFDINELNRFLNESEQKLVMKKLFNFGEKYFVKAMNSKSKKKYFETLIFLMLSFISPMYLEYLYRLINTKLKCKLYQWKRLN